MGLKKVLKCNLDVVECWVNTPIGRMKFKSCEKGLHELSQLDEINDSNFSPNDKAEVEMISVEPLGAFETYRPAIACFEWLKSYFSQPFRSMAKPPLCLPPFDNATYQQRVWMVLNSDVQAGQTVSYGRLAEMTNNPKAARAVGTAMMCNPYMLVVPCHRVIRSDGTIGLFAHGRRQKVKRWLLEHEKVV
ncbi:hypothetical protein CHUAL_011830 [Chamberlinius hualienensis]